MTGLIGLLGVGISAGAFGRWGLQRRRLRADAELLALLPSGRGQQMLATHLDNQVGRYVVTKELSVPTSSAVLMLIAMTSWAVPSAVLVAALIGERGFGWDGISSTVKWALIVVQFLGMVGMPIVWRWRYRPHFVKVDADLASGAFASKWGKSPDEVSE